MRGWALFGRAGWGGVDVRLGCTLPRQKDPPATRQRHRAVPNNYEGRPQGGAAALRAGADAT